LTAAQALCITSPSSQHRETPMPRLMCPKNWDHTQFTRVVHGTEVWTYDPEGYLLRRSVFQSGAKDEFLCAECKVPALNSGVDS
jgi:hypothetical protein